MKKKKLFKALTIITLLITVIILGLSLYLNISEIIAMKKCAQIEGCMYCVPIKSLIAYFGYILSFCVFTFTILFFCLYKKNKMN